MIWSPLQVAAHARTNTPRVWSMCNSERPRVACSRSAVLEGCVRVPGPHDRSHLSAPSPPFRPNQTGSGHAVREGQGTMAKSRVNLTPRERDVVRRVIDGRKNREIARELGLTEQTIKNVLSTIYAKCNVRNRLQLVLYAVRHDILSR